jgi:hypothetical protein
MTKSTRILFAVGVLLLLGGAVKGATIWTGNPITFTDIAGSDPSLPQNQDRLTTNVWITRGGLQGIYNIAQEGSFAHFLSPKDTAWADGAAANYLSLSFTDWDTWAKNLHGGPPSTVGVHAVMRLITDDIYLNVTFTSWGGSAGGFAYLRSTPVIYLPGDADRNGTVNGADLNTVLSNYNGSFTGDTWALGDFDGNSTVNGADLNTVLSNYNQSSVVGAAVPEPSGFILVMVGALGAIDSWWRWKTRAS